MNYLKEAQDTKLRKRQFVQAALSSAGANHKAASFIIRMLAPPCLVKEFLPRRNPCRDCECCPLKAFSIPQKSVPGSVFLFKNCLLDGVENVKAFRPKAVMNLSTSDIGQADLVKFFV